MAAATGVLMSAPLAAHARRHITWIVRDGFYAGLDSSSGDLAFFHIKNHRVYHLRFSLTLSCQDDTTGQQYTPNYSAGSAMSQGLKIPAAECCGSNGLRWVQPATDTSPRSCASIATPSPVSRC